MKKVLFVATVVKTHIMEFHIPYLKMFKEHGWETAVAAWNDYENPEDCVIQYCDTYYNIPFERNPLKPGNWKAYKELKKVIDNGGYDIIHCHTPVGAMLTRLAAKQARKNGTKVFYTAHGFHFYKGAPALNWLLYYPVEKWLSRYTDVLITINKEDYERAKTFKAGRVCYVPGVGIDLKKFMTSDDLHEEKRSWLCKKFDIPEDAVILLSVGEVNKNKNHRVVIEALGKLKRKDIYYVICGRGPLQNEYRALANQLKIGKQVIIAGYRTDVADFYKAADVFVFPSFREGLPVSVMEAMASGLPVIATCIRGSSDIVKEKNNGVLLKPDDVEGFANAIDAFRNVDLIKSISKTNANESMKYDLDAVIKLYQRVYFGEGE